MAEPTFFDFLSAAAVFVVLCPFLLPLLIIFGGALVSLFRAPRDEPVRVVYVDRPTEPTETPMQPWIFTERK